MDLSMIVRVDLVHEVSNFFVGDRGGNVFLQHSFDLCMGHISSALFIENCETICRFFFVAVTHTEFVANCMLNESGVNMRSLQELVVQLYQVTVDMAELLPMVTEIVQNVAELIVYSDVASLFFIVEVESFVQICDDLRAEHVAVKLDIRLNPCEIERLSLFRCFLTRHFFQIKNNA